MIICKHPPCLGYSSHKFITRCSLEVHVQVAYLELQWISSICHYLITDTTKILICAFVFSRNVQLVYFWLLLEEHRITKFQGLANAIVCQAAFPINFLVLKRIQKSIAYLICRLSRSEHITSISCSLHWLTVTDCVAYKLSMQTYSAVSGIGLSTCLNSVVYAHGWTNSTVYIPV